MLLPSALGFSPHPPVSVYGTGMCITIAAFLGTWLTCFPTLVRSTSRLRIVRKICCPYSYHACTGFLFPGSCSPHASPTVLGTHSTGISTCYPSTTSFDLALGPDLPRADQLYSETLDIRPEGFSPSSRYSFRHSLFLALHCSLSVQLRCANNAPLPLLKGVLSFGVVFQPRTFSAQDLSTSELLRTL